MPVDTAAASQATNQVGNLLTGALDTLERAGNNVATARVNLASLFTTRPTDKPSYDAFAAGAKDIAAFAASQGVPVNGLDSALGNLKSALGLGMDLSWVKYALALVLVGGAIGGVLWYTKKSGGGKLKLPPWRMKSVSSGRRGAKRSSRRGAIKMRRRGTGVWEPEEDLEGLDEGEMEGST